MDRKAVTGITLTLLLIGVLGLVFDVGLVGAGGTIYIEADGSVNPPSAPIQRDGNVYTFTSNIYDSIYVRRSNIIIDGNGYTLQGTGTGHGFDLSYSKSNVTIKNTYIKQFTNGIVLSYGCTGNIISGNTVQNNSNAGIDLNYDSNGNIISGNTVQNNDYFGIELCYSSTKNIIYHNNFINNLVHAIIMYDTSGYSNTWDDGYPSGGNYWDDYTGVDFYSGPYQNITGSDGIGDTPRAIYANNPDRYPLMNPWTLSYTLTITATAGGTTDPAPGTYICAAGTGVIVSAIPDINHIFDHWELDGSWNYSNPISVTMDVNHTLHAVFKTGFPVGTFVIPMDEKQNLLTTENVTIYGFIWAILDAGADIYRIIEPPDVTLKTTTYPGGAVYSGGVILVLPTYEDIIEEKRLIFPNVTIDTLTEPFGASPDQLFFVEKPTKILVIQGIWGHTEVTLDWMKIPYTLVIRNAIEINAAIIHDYDLVVDDCPGWWGSMPNHVVSNFTSFANNGGEVVFTDIALLDLAQVFPGYVNVVGNLDWIGNVSIHNPPLTGFSSEFPSQYPTTFPNTTKIYTMGGGNIVDTILNITEVRVLMDTSEYGGANRTLAFYFPYGDGLVEGFAYHPQEQIEAITGDPYSYVISSSFYGNNFIHAIPTHDVAVTDVKPSKTVVGQGCSLNVNVTAANQGDYTETFNVTTYYNDIPIETKTVTNLPPGEEKTVTFTWDTTGCAMDVYIISANATKILGEIATDDNALIDGTVQIATVGDLNGDGHVDVSDLCLLSNYWFNVPHYNPQMDINNDGITDVSDLTLLSDNWFKGPLD